MKTPIQDDLFEPCISGLLEGLELAEALMTPGGDGKFLMHVDNHSSLSLRLDPGEGVGMATSLLKLWANKPAVFSMETLITSGETQGGAQEPDRLSTEERKTMLVSNEAHAKCQDCGHVQFDSQHPFILETDAITKGLGAVLAQQQKDQKVHTIAFTSYSLTAAETNYAITEFQTIGLVWAVEAVSSLHPWSTLHCVY